MQVVEAVKQPDGTVETERRRSLIKAKLREGLLKLPLDAYDFSRGSAEAWLRLEAAADEYGKGNRTLEEVRDVFKAYVAAHEIAPSLF